jgi:tRNA(adenine34) deaminase
VLLEFVERLDLRNIVLVVQDWGGILGLTLPMEAPERYRGLLLMNTALGTGDAPLSPGFLAWREMCAKNPDFGIGRLFARGNPQMSPEECAAYDAPFPDAGHRAATRAFPAMVPDGPTPTAPKSRAGARLPGAAWQGQAMMAVGARDPVLGVPAMEALQAAGRGCRTPLVLPQAGHFVQEPRRAGRARGSGILPPVTQRIYIYSPSSAVRNKAAVRAASRG